MTRVGIRQLSLRESMSYYTTPDDKSSPFFQVEGWVHPNMPQVMQFVSAMLSAHASPPHSAAEIGVHHGRFFLVLEELCLGASFCDAFDVFEDQALNIDRSGHGSKERFLSNVASYATNPSRVRAFQIDSIELGTGSRPNGQDTRYSLISVDGCHTALHTCNDLLFSECSIAPGGVVVLDDISNLSWLGVFEGACRYLGGVAPRLAPFAVGYNKLLLTPVGYQRRYFDFFVNRREELATFPKFTGGPVTTELFGYRVCRFGA
jgi:hypothetical protein